MTIKKGLIFVTIIGVVTLFAFAPNELKNKFLSSDVFNSVEKIKNEKESIKLEEKEKPRVSFVFIYNLIATGVGDGSVSLSWKASSKDEIIEDYIIEYNEPLSKTWFIFNDGVKKNTTEVVTGLKNEKFYNFRVFAKTNLGVSEPSNGVTGVPTSSLIRIDPSFKVSLPDVNFDNLTIDEKGNIYAIGRSSKMIYKFDSSGKLLMKIGKGLLESGALESVNVDASGNIYVTMIGDGSLVYSVMRFDATGKNTLKIPSIFKDPKVIPYISDAEDIAFDTFGNFYVLDGRIVHKLDQSGKFLEQIIKNGDGKLSEPESILIDNNNIYILEGTMGNIGKENIKKFDISGEFVSKFSIQLSNDTVGAIWPRDMTIDKEGYIYVTDALNGLQKFDKSGHLITTSAKFPPNSLASRGGLGIDKKGNIFIPASHGTILKYIQISPKQK